MSSKISDEELVCTLRKYGIESPVTASTRNILIKKLNNLLSQENNQKEAVSKNLFSTQSSKKRPYRNLGNYSSDEEDEADQGQQSYSQSSEELNNSYAEQNSILGRLRTKRNSTSPENHRRDETSSRYIKNNYNGIKSYNNNHYDSYSDSDIDEPLSKLGESSYSEHDNPFNSYKNFKLFDSKDDTRNLPVISTVANSHRGTETRIIHNRKVIGDKVVSPDGIVTREAQNGNSFLDSLSDLSSFASESFLERSWSQCVSLLLVIFCVFFFLIVGLCYIKINSHSNIFSQFSSPALMDDPKSLPEDQRIESSTDLYASYDDDAIPTCKKDVNERNCLTTSERFSLLQILSSIEKVLVPELRKQASFYQCGYVDFHYISSNNMAQILRNSLPENNEVHIEAGLNGFAKLADLNEVFGLQTIWHKDGSPVGLAVHPLPKEYLCHFISFLKKILYLACAVVIVCLGGIGMLKLLKLSNKKQNDVENECFELVEKIITLIEEKCVSEGKEFVVVEHIRDSLIEPRSRLAKAPLWKRALQFIKEHESRVSMEVQVVNGEERMVWKWTTNFTSSLAYPERPTGKVWQGNAFESIESTQDLPRVSPSSCLKIRKMFRPDLEYGDDWPRRVQESILEKCADASIVHVAVDQASVEGCVYVKCASVTDAGKAFRALQGTWYDGNLVTVKYLRDEKYYARFPAARTAKKPLRCGRSNSRI